MSRGAAIVGCTPEGHRVNVTLGEATRVGSANADVVLKVPGVSRTHARFVREQDDYFIEDQSSRGGTWVNGERVTRARLRHLDVVTLGTGFDLVFLAARSGPALGDISVRLEWADGPQKGKAVEIRAGASIIGRGESSAIVVDRSEVSRAHARLTVADGVLTLEDLGSSNGTFVSGQRLTAAITLRHLDEIDVSHVARFRVRIARSNVSAQTTVPPAADPQAIETVVLVPPAVAEWQTRLMGPDELIAFPGTQLASGHTSGVNLEKGTVVMAPSPSPLQMPELGAETSETRASASWTSAPTMAPSIGSRGAGKAGRATPAVPTVAPVKGLKGIRMTGDAGSFTVPLGRSSVGRAPEAAVRIDSRLVSRLHVIITVTDHGASVEDQRSANGTSLNGTKFSGERALSDKDRLSLGSVEFSIAFLFEGATPG